MARAGRRVRCCPDPPLGDSLSRSWCCVVSKIQRLRFPPTTLASVIMVSTAVMGPRSCPLGLLAISLRNRSGDEPLASLAARRAAIGSAPIREGCWVNINSHYYVSVRLEFLLHFRRDL